jgi:signal peptidase I
MTTLLTRLRARRFHKKQLQQIRVVLERAPKRGLAGSPAAQRLTGLVTDLKAALAKGDFARCESLEDDAAALVERDLPSCAKATLLESFLSLFWAVLAALAIRAFLVEPFQIPTGSMIPTLQIGDHIFVNKLAYGFRIPLVNWHLAKWADPERGDIVIFPYPVPGPDQGKDYIKRIVGLPGDRLHLDDNVLVINGQRVEVTPFTTGIPCMDSTPPKIRCDTQIETLGTHTILTQHQDDASCAYRGSCDSTWPARTRPTCFGMSPCLYFGAGDQNPDWPDVVIPEGHYLMMGDNRDNSSDGRYWGLVSRSDILGKAMFIWWAQDKRRLFEAIH